MLRGNPGREYDRCKNTETESMLWFFNKCGSKAGNKECFIGGRRSYNGQFQVTVFSRFRYVLLCIHEYIHCLNHRQAKDYITRRNETERKLQLKEGQTLLQIIGLIFSWFLTGLAVVSSVIFLASNLSLCLLQKNWQFVKRCLRCFFPNM